MRQFIGGDDGISTTIINTDLGNANTSYTYFNMAGEDWRYAIIAASAVEATTLTLEASMNSMRTADADATWVDITALIAAAATLTAAGTWLLEDAVPTNRCRVKRVTTHATNALTLNIIRSS